jgi:hypothetical protein
MYQKCHVVKIRCSVAHCILGQETLRYLQAPKTAVSLRAIQSATSLGYWRSNAVISQRQLVPGSDDGQRRQERFNDDIVQGTSRRSRLELCHNREAVRPLSSFLTDNYSRQHN